MVNKRKQHKARILLIIALSLSGILIIALVMLTSVLIDYGRGRKLYLQASELAVTSVEQMQAPASASIQPEIAASPAQIETSPIEVDFVALRLEGRHVLGWLYSENTLINYPVVYYSNNNYYLTRDYTGSHSEGGALFFDCRLTKQLKEQNLIIYGHHMKDRSMFGSLLQYQKQSYYEEHPTMYLLTPEKNYRIDLFAAQFTTSEEEQFPVWFESEEKKQAFVQSAISNSTFKPVDAAYRADGQIISLVTCAYSDYIIDAKFQVQGWLTEIG